MNKAQSLYLQIKELEGLLEIEQNDCIHPNLNLEDDIDDPFADPFSVQIELKEYQCPDCLLKIVQ